VLNAVLGFDDGPAPNRLAVLDATLELLRRAAATRPVLLVVDDLPWLDRATARVFGVVARRLTGSHIGFLATSRWGQDKFFEHAGLPDLGVGPLDDTPASVLLDANFPRLACGVRKRLLAEAKGNPLALLELPTALSVPQLVALEELPAVLPLTRRLRALFDS